MQNKIKLVQVIADSEVGGGANHVLSLLKNIDKEKFDCFLICPAGYLAVESRKIHRLQTIIIPMRSKFDVVSIFELRSILGQIQALGQPFGPMIVHSHGARAGLFALLSAPHSAKKIFTEHIYDKSYHLNNIVNDQIQRRLLRKIYNKSDEIIAVSSSVRDYLLGLGLDKYKIILISNGIDLAKSEKRKAKSPLNNSRAPIIGTIGSLNRTKGFNYLIGAMPHILKKYPLATLEIIGEGPERQRLIDDSRQYGIEKHVSLLGKKLDIHKYLDYWDVFVLPSTSETFGIVVLEALQAGVPVVASKVGGIPDIINNNENGLLFEPANPKAIVKAVLEIMEHPVLAAKFKREGAKSLQKFAWSKIIKKIELIYFELVK